MLPFIDTHAHLSMLHKRGLDSHEILRNLFAGGFSGIIDISLESGDLPERIREFSTYPQIRFASGLWPHAQSIARRYKLVQELEKDIRQAGALVCALGEFGLDHHWNVPPNPQGEVPLRYLPPNPQGEVPLRNGEDHVPSGGTEDMAGERELMEMQLDLAQRLGLPVIIHSRDAPEETREILAAYPGIKGVIHCFSYAAEEAKTFLDLGFYISFAGNITYKNAQNIRDACAIVPPDRILLETDCPYLAPVPLRGKPAHPGMVEENYKAAAEIRKTDPAALVELTVKNTFALFGVDFTV
jgi:TatD DNase family protein